MAATPPPLKQPPNLRMAAAANMVLPGVGLFIIGRRRGGALLAGGFLACFVAVLTIFLVGYARYLSLAMSEDLLKGDKLERAGQVFPRGWLLTLAGAGVAIHVTSMIWFSAAKRKLEVNAPRR